jgi:hypothetical protein
MRLINGALYVHTTDNAELAELAETKRLCAFRGFGVDRRCPV